MTTDCECNYCQWSDNDPRMCRCVECDPDWYRDQQQAREQEGRDE
jgi:hypothetical protein